MKKLTIDSSVIIASLLENEVRHGEAMRIWDAVISGQDVAIMPYSVFVEVVAAVRRRTGSEELAYEAASSDATPRSGRQARPGGREGAPLGRMGETGGDSFCNLGCCPTLGKVNDQVFHGSPLLSVNEASFPVYSLSLNSWAMR